MYQMQGTRSPIELLGTTKKKVNLPLKLKQLSPGFDKRNEALVSCVCLWVLHSGQKSCHRLPGDHPHLLGHPRPVHSKCKELKRFLDISIFNSSFKLFRKMPSSNLPLSSPTGSYDVFQVISISCLKIKSVGTGTLSFKFKVNLLLLIDICQICKL